MTVKSVRGRRRYVVFSVGGPVSRQTISAAASAGDPDSKVMMVKENMAVVRTSPAKTGSVIKSVTENIPGSASLRTSGTLKTLRGRYKKLGKGSGPRDKPLKRSAVKK